MRARVVGVALAVMLGASPAASEDASLETDDRRLSLRAIWGSVLFAAAALAALQFGAEPPESPRWSSRNDFDTGITDGLGESSPDGRDAAETASDVLLAGLGAGLVADWVLLRDEYDLVRSIGNDALYSLGAITTTRGAKLVAGRERPLARECERNSSFSRACGGLGSDANASFFSGHASTSAALAGLLCARHLHRAERGRSDIAICAGAGLVSATTGALRIVAHSHWASDVIVGWVAGWAFGYWLPSRFEYSRGPGRPSSSFAVVPEMGVDRYGFRLQLEF